MNLEVSHKQRELSKIEQDIEVASKKLNQVQTEDTLSEEAKSQFQELGQFQHIMTQHLQKSKQIVAPLIDKGTKMLVHELARANNDHDYEITQKEVALKKQFDVKMNNLKHEQEDELQSRFDEVENERNGQY